MPDTAYKRCGGCGETKTLEEFHRSKQSRDGRAWRCKLCKREGQREWDSANREKKREYVRRYRTKHPEKEKENRTRWRDANRDKMHAHAVLQWAVFKGRVVKPESCESCSRSGDLEAHHADYTKPLDVEWLCLVCHGETRHVGEEKE